MYSRKRQRDNQYRRPNSNKWVRKVNDDTEAALASTEKTISQDASSTVVTEKAQGSSLHQIQHSTRPLLKGPRQFAKSSALTSKDASKRQTRFSERSKCYRHDGSWKRPATQNLQQSSEVTLSDTKNGGKSEEKSLVGPKLSGPRRTTWKREDKAIRGTVADEKKLDERKTTHNLQRSSAVTLSDTKHDGKSEEKSSLGPKLSGPRRTTWKREDTAIGGTVADEKKLVERKATHNLQRSSEVTLPDTKHDGESAKKSSVGPKLSGPRRRTKWKRNEETRTEGSPVNKRNASRSTAVNATALSLDRREKSLAELMTYNKRGRCWVDQRRSNGPIPGAKRIKVSTIADTAEDEEGQGDNTDKRKVTERLTDFAYRETAPAVAKRSSNNLTLNPARISREKGRSMGLVRVQPDESRTKICPTFLRGLPCTDETCMKRHDVPKEYATPVCSFFQRQGMCMKEDCPFRHVKLPPRTTVCPSFLLLGFCDDKDCVMMHSRPRPSGTGKSHHTKKGGTE